MANRTVLEQLIRERRTVNTFLPDPLPIDTIEAILSAATWAPFHSKEEPWRFILFEGEGRKRFSEAVLATYETDKLQKIGEGVHEVYCHEVPLHLLVVMRVDEQTKQWEEAICATSALIQNLQLLAWEQQIGVVWKTNAYNEDPRFLERVGVAATEKVVGTLHMGYFDTTKLRKPKPRTPLNKLLTHIRQ